MTELEEKAIAALIEAPPNTDPFGDPVEDMASKLGLATEVARTLTGRLLSERRIHTVTAPPANNFSEPGRLILIRYVWGRVPDA
jgi:hypothetical protein